MATDSIASANNHSHPRLHSPPAFTSLRQSGYSTDPNVNANEIRNEATGQDEMRWNSRFYPQLVTIMDSISLGNYKRDYHRTLDDGKRNTEERYLYTVAELTEESR